MTSHDYPMTTAVRMLRAKDIAFTPHLYPYEEHGGTSHAAKCLGMDEHRIVKTLVMQADPRVFFLVLMHGDREVSTRNLARELGFRHVTPAEVDAAQRVTGYQVGGISPFGVRTTVPVCAEHTVLTLPSIFLNGGKRGFLVELDPGDLSKAFSVTEVHVAITETAG
jgi:Cys-tRNA(Pro) deacylase